MLDGPSKDSGPSKSIAVVAPSSGYVQKFSGIRHYQNWWSCGFKGDIFVLPNNVSFANLWFYEAEIGATANGWLSFLNTQGHGANTSALGIGFGNIGTGARVISDGDEVFSGKRGEAEHGPYATGRVNWAIPWYFSVTGGGGTWHIITTVNQTATSTSTGRCTIQKDGSVTIVTELGDPDSEW